MSKTLLKWLETEARWHQLPKDGGQIVDVHYACDDTHLYCRTIDRSERKPQPVYEMAEYDSEADEDALRFEPQNGRLPRVGDWEDVIAGYRLEMRDDQCSESVTFDDEPDAAEIREACEDWIEGGDWGDAGARIGVDWTLYAMPNDTEVNSGSVMVDVEPDHDALIAAAGGDTDCDHDWTGEGEGGCDENPGVWSTGGTSMSFHRHCRKCGLHRIEHSTGSQHNPGEHDTVEYRQMDDEEIEQHIANGSMDEREVEAE